MKRFGVRCHNYQQNEFDQTEFASTGGLMRTRVFLLALLFLTPSYCLAQENFGSFTGTVKVEWLQESGADRQMRLLEHFAFNDPSATVWGVPKGAVINGASIPRPLWTLVGDPYIGDYRNASVVHDYHCEIRTRSWEEVHRMFYWAMRAGGVGRLRAKVMYAAVYRFGPRWKDVKVTTTKQGGAQEAALVTYQMEVTWREPFDKESLDSLMKWIEEKDPSLDQIEQRPLENKVITNEPPSKLDFPGKPGTEKELP
jgi:hypothetical protein